MAAMPQPSRVLIGLIVVALAGVEGAAQFRRVITAMRERK